MPRPAPDYPKARRAGRSGLVLPPLSLGLWQNFGETRSFETQRAIILEAFDQGVWHFDNANRYGPPTGWAEEVLGKVLSCDLAGHRSSLVIATKAANPIATGPYGRGASRKHLVESLDESLERLGLDHVDVFYSHSPDPSTPIEETAEALQHIVASGRALYVGISNYDPAQTREAAAAMDAAGVPLVVHQHRYSLLARTPEEGLHDMLREKSIGGVIYSPLAQGLLTDRYLDGEIAPEARAAWSPFLGAGAITEDYLAVARRLQAIAESRGQTLAQLALTWALANPAITSALVGASSVAQLRSNLAALTGPALDASTTEAIEAALVG